MTAPEKLSTEFNNGWSDSEVGPYKVNSLIITPQADPVAGRVHIDHGRAAWNIVMLTTSIIMGPLYFTWDAFLLFFIFLEITMCAGHSVGFHRRLIHRTFECNKWVERFLVWLGVLVGMQGPFWVMRSHDIRDWAQRQPSCHSFLKHGSGFKMDGWWNLCCRLQLDNPPKFNPGRGIGDDPFYIFLQKTWMLQQLPVAVLLFWLGGMPWLIWGVFVRVSVGVSMHWMVGYYCHTHGPQNWLVDNGAVQAHDVPLVAIFSMGESWHNNHHAFPTSARHGIFPGQIDLGYRFVELLASLRLAWNIKIALELPVRKGVSAITPIADNFLKLQMENSMESKDKHVKAMSS